MQQYIRTVTQNLLSRITDQQLHYTPKDLLDVGFPDFVVQRIELDLQRNLAESVTLPDSDWADMQADPVLDAWDHFLEAIHAETRIPDSFLQSVVENAVEDILELLAEPERYVLDTLFRNEQEVSILELHARRPWIVLNGHLAEAIIRYMQRRNMQMMARDKAATIIRQIDQHLASGYTPLKWAQALDVCFALMGQRVPSTLFVRYFADKGLSDIAKRMENADEDLSKSRLIEYLSMPDLNWDEDDESDMPAAPVKQQHETTTDAPARTQTQMLSESQTETTPESQTETTPESQTEATPESQTETPSDSQSEMHTFREHGVQSQSAGKETHPDADETLPELADEEPSSGEAFFAALAESDEDENESDEAPKANSFWFAHANDQDDEQEDEHEVEPSSILSSYAQSETEESDDEADENQFNFGTEDETEDEHEAQDEPSDILSSYAYTESDEQVESKTLEQDDELVTPDTFDELDEEPERSPSTGDDGVPIWQRFLNAEDTDDNQNESGIPPYRPALGYQIEDDTEWDADEQDVQIYEQHEQTNEQLNSDDKNLSRPPDYPKLSAEATRLLNQLDAHAEIILDSLFQGDLKLFYNTLNTIVKYENWQQAGKYLTRELFIPLEIDMYSGEAILFVDLLQQYFEQNNS